MRLESWFQDSRTLKIESSGEKGISTSAVISAGLWTCFRLWASHVVMKPNRLWSLHLVPLYYSSFILDWRCQKIIGIWNLPPAMHLARMARGYGFRRHTQPLPVRSITTLKSLRFLVGSALTAEYRVLHLDSLCPQYHIILYRIAKNVPNSFAHSALRPLGMIDFLIDRKSFQTPPPLLVRSRIWKSACRYDMYWGKSCFAWKKPLSYNFIYLTLL